MRRSRLVARAKGVFFCSTEPPTISSFQGVTSPRLPRSRSPFKVCLMESASTKLAGISSDEITFDALVNRIRKTPEFVDLLHTDQWIAFFALYERFKKRQLSKVEFTKQAADIVGKRRFLNVVRSLRYANVRAKLPAVVCSQATLEPAKAGDSEKAANACARTTASTTCVVCLSADATHAFFPCGHLCMCQECVPEQFPTRCYMCRMEVIGAAKIWI